MVRAAFLTALALPDTLLALVGQEFSTHGGSVFLLVRVYVSVVLWGARLFFESQIGI